MDEVYYKELQNTLRSYDQKLWQIPSLFFGVVGFMISNIELEGSKSLQDGLIVLVGSLFLCILILLYTKAHIFHISIQKKINEFDRKSFENAEQPKRMPLTSMTNEELENRIHELEGKYLENERGNEGARFNCIQKFLARRRVSSWINNIMLLIFLTSILFSIYYFTDYFL